MLTSLLLPQGRGESRWGEPKAGQCTIPHGLTLKKKLQNCCGRKHFHSLASLSVIYGGTTGGRGLTAISNSWRYRLNHNAALGRLSLLVFLFCLATPALFASGTSVACVLASDGALMHVKPSCTIRHTQYTVSMHTNPTQHSPPPTHPPSTHHRASPRPADSRPYARC